MRVVRRVARFTVQDRMLLVRLREASYKDVTCSAPRKAATLMSHWGQVLGVAQVTPEELTLSAGLGTSKDPL